MFESLLFTLSLLLGLSASHAHSAPPQEWEIDDSYYSIGYVEIRETDVTVDDLVEVYSSTQEPKNLSVPKEINLAEIINVGKKVWKVIVDNKPVVDVQLLRASAVPQGIQHWLQMEGWHDPVAKKYQVVYKNLYGIEVVKFEFLLTYSYNGQVNGRGRYLSEVGFVPSTVTVAWMYNFTATSQVVRTINVGTADDPIAAIEINLNWTVKTPLKEDRRANNFYIRGDGSYRAL